MSRVGNRARLLFNAAAGAVLRAVGPDLDLGTGGHITVLHDYEGAYAHTGMGPASHRGVLEMLDIERDVGLRTTYNVVGRLAQDLPEVVERILSDGHEVAGHTYDHRSMSSMGTAELRRDLELTLECLAPFGVRIRGMRAPKGRWDFRLLRVMAEFGLEWSAEGDTATAPYHVLPGKVLRFPVRIGDHVQYRRFADAGRVLDNFTRVVDAVAREGGYAALAFHPWVQAQSPDRMEAYAHLLERIAGTSGITVLPFADLVDRLGAPQPTAPPVNDGPGPR